MQPQTGWVLFGARAPRCPRSTTCARSRPGLHFAGSLEVLRRVAGGSRPARFACLLGYAGWGPGQLEHELAEGAWLLAPAEGGAVFEVPNDEMWAHVVRSLGVEPATLGGEPRGPLIARGSRAGTSSTQLRAAPMYGHG